MLLNRSFYNRHNGLDKLAQEATRQDNIMDLILTNSPLLVPTVDVIPELSDHDILYCNFNIIIQKMRQMLWMIPPYNKAECSSMKIAMIDLHTTVVKGQDITEKLCQGTLTDAVQKFIPRKQVHPKSSKPWVTPNINKLINKRDSLKTDEKTGD